MKRRIRRRTRATGFFYRKLAKPLFFLFFDPETAHNRIAGLGHRLGRHRQTRRLTRQALSFQDQSLEQKILGINFPNPIGLAAGFDKEATLIDILPSVGFGFMEIGSVTARPYGGNQPPRLFRLKKSRGLVVNFGLKSSGAKVVKERLENRSFEIPLGISIAMSNCPETADLKIGVEDFADTFQQFSRLGDYLTVNTSCPNTVLGQPFHEANNLDRLLEELDKISTSRPVFLKLSPDSSDSHLEKLLKVIARHRVHGLICGNLTKNRDNARVIDRHLPSQGGVSGKPVEELSNQLIQKIYQKTSGKYVIIGCGGVFNAEDAYKKIRLGASLVQLITGMIFQGPQLIGEINQGLVSLLNKDGLTSISEAIGRDARVDKLTA